MKIKASIMLVSMAFFQMGCASDLYYYNGKQEVELKRVYGNSLSKSTSSLDMYETTSGVKLGVGDTLIVKFNDNTNLENYLLTYNLKIEKELKNNVYVLKTTDKSLTLQIANELAVQEDVKFAEPNFYQEVQKR